MWSFPIVSLALGLLSWRRTKLKLPLVILMVGLALQTFSYLDFRIATTVGNQALVALGKGLFIGLLYILFFDLGDEAHRPRMSQEKPELYSRVQLKVILLSGMIFLTLSNLVDAKTSEALLAILCILFPAIFWKKIKKLDPGLISAALFVGLMAFLSFLLTWSKYLVDYFNLSPILWMLSFSAGFFIFLNLGEQR